MCTVTIATQSDGFEIIMNRDERFDRPPESPPGWITPDIFGPLDPQSGGTWIAHNKKGAWGCLLNGYFELHDTGTKGKKSRGNILLDMLAQENPLNYAAAFKASPYQSFRLIIGTKTQHKLFVWDGRIYKEQDFYAAQDKAFMISSSSLRQDEVLAHRKNLFLNHKGPLIDFHKINNSPEIDPLMRRDYSRTTSITVMNITKHAAQMSYFEELTINPRVER